MLSRVAGRTAWGVVAWLAPVMFGTTPIAGAQERESESAALSRFEYAEPHMGAEFRIVLYAPSREVADGGVGDAFRRVALLDSLLSDYRHDSEIATLAARAGTGDTVWVHPQTMQVLALSVLFARMTDGAFDPTIGPLSRLWRWSVRRGELPDGARLAHARSRVGYDRIAFTDAGGVLLTREGMALDLGGIAKGFAADEAGKVLAAAGLTRFLVDAGGDVVVGGPPPGKDGWRVVTPSGRVVRLVDAAVATSGDTYRYVEVDGTRYSHLLDPRTGLGVVGVEPVTVVAPNGATADALASALTVMDRASGNALLARFPSAIRVEPEGAH